MRKNQRFRHTHGCASIGYRLISFRKHFICLAVVLSIVAFLRDSREGIYQARTVSDLDGSCIPEVNSHDVEQYLSTLAAESRTVDIREKDMNIVLLFDTQSMLNALSLMRSSMAVSSRRLHFHLVTPNDTFTSLLASSLRPPDETLSFYDMSLCEDLVKDIRPLADPTLHVALLCTLFVPQLLPASITRALVLDTDISAVQDYSPCYDAKMGREEMIGMVPDTGDGCIFQPEWCWPMAYETDTPPGLICKVFGTYFEDWWPQSFFWKLRNPVCSCRNQRSCWREPVYFNGGVMLMDLEKMRKQRFIASLVSFSRESFLSLHLEPAKYGDQCLINNFFRKWPEILRVLPCGCNYQYSSRRKAIWCANKPVFLAHGWSQGIIRESTDPYNRHFHYFKGTCESCCGMPVAPKISLAIHENNFSALVGPKLLHDQLCLHQSYNCQVLEREYSQP